ncbi:TadE/TadG family type IV pilus assembly protein [Nocardioides sp. DS6]|uniref:TadE/TadG family type IV pilus assembly protein n=1 Tax=Nocardioides eburneus TaxID=3231482 RepID=A0ABV3SXF4_9ACTN
MRRRPDRGSAVVDFVLVTLVLVPVVLAVVQLALVLYVRNTLASAASEGARYGATLGHRPGDGALRAQDQIRGVLSHRYARGVSARSTRIDGAPAVEVTIRAKVPALGLAGPAVSFTVRGHAVQEQP